MSFWDFVKGTGEYSPEAIKKREEEAARKKRENPTCGDCDHRTTNMMGERVCGVKWFHWAFENDKACDKFKPKK
jgi:hypothetical protein